MMTTPSQPAWLTVFGPGRRATEVRGRVAMSICTFTHDPATGQLVESKAMLDKWKGQEATCQPSTGLIADLDQEGDA